jgi:hypothetical protein
MWIFYVLIEYVPKLSNHMVFEISHMKCKIVKHKERKKFSFWLVLLKLCKSRSLFLLFSLNKTYYYMPLNSKFYKKIERSRKHLNSYFVQNCFNILMDYFFPFYYNIINSYLWIHFNWTKYTQVAKHQQCYKSFAVIVI